MAKKPRKPLPLFGNYRPIPPKPSKIPWVYAWTGWEKSKAPVQDLCNWLVKSLRTATVNLEGIILQGPDTVSIRTKLADGSYAQHLYGEEDRVVFFLEMDQNTGNYCVRALAPDLFLARFKPVKE